MRITSHIEKFRRLDALTRRLDRDADRELWIWTAMNAATQLLNAALHRHGITAETDSFHTQVEGLYASPDRSTGALQDLVEAPGDVMHVGQPRIDASLPDAIEHACKALQVIERLREPYVRGDESPDSGEIRQWEDAYRECIAQLTMALDARFDHAT